MLIGVNTYTMGFAGSGEAALAKAAEIGFEGIEFRPNDLGLSGKLENVKEDAAKVKDICERTGIAPCTVACDADFVQPDPAEFDRYVKLGEYCAALSSELGLPVVKYFAGEPKPGLSDEEIIDYMIRGSSELAHLGEKYNVSFAEENHGFFTNNPEVQLQLLRGVESRRLGLCIDSSNYRWFGHSVERVNELFREMAPYTMHTHMKDGDGSAGRVQNYKATALGEGELDIPGLLRELKNNNYKGVLVLEYEGPDGEAGVRRSFEYLKKLRDEIFGA